MMTSKGHSQTDPKFSGRTATRSGSQSAQRVCQSGVCVRVFSQRISGLWIYFAHFWQLNFIFSIVRARCSRDATVPGEHSSSAAASA